MNLKSYLKSLGSDAARQKFAADCDTSVGHMRNCLYTDGKRLHPAVCVLVEKNSNGSVLREELRDDWQAIWPDLIDMNRPRVPDPADAAAARETAQQAG